MARSTRQKKDKGYVFNIKLTSPDRLGENVIGDLLLNIFESKIIKPVTSDREILIRTAYAKEVSETKLVFGSFASGIDLTNSVALNLNQPELDINNPIATNLRVKVLSNEFVYVYRAHRLFFIKKSKDSIPKTQIEKFLNDSLNHVIQEDERIEVIIEKDERSIEQIFNAQKIEWIDIQLTRSNNDTNEDSAAWLENELDSARSNKISLKASSDDPAGVNSASRLINGALNLVPSNGRARAKVIDQGGYKDKIDTEKFVREFTSNYIDESDRLYAAARLIMSLFRNSKS